MAYELGGLAWLVEEMVVVLAVARVGSQEFVRAFTWSYARD